jgi:IS1 family transposase
MANHLSKEKRLAVVGALVEGNSIRSTERMTGVHRDTICRLLVKIGEACRGFLSTKMQGLSCQHLQADEIWTFVAKKQKALLEAEALQGEKGDQYVFVAMDRETKLVPVFRVGKRDGNTTHAFLTDLRDCLDDCRPQLSTDGWESYHDAVESVFGPGIDYAQVVKEYATNDSGYRKVSACIKRPIAGRPRDKEICTSHIERQNLTMRMCIRRLTRRVNAFSKKLRNLKAAVALYFAHYNFCRIHTTLRCTPAMEAGLTDHVWDLNELLALAV